MLITDLKSVQFGYEFHCPYYKKAYICRKNAGNKIVPGSYWTFLHRFINQYVLCDTRRLWQCRVQERAQLAEHRVVVPKVAGSSPVGHPESGFRKDGNGGVAR
jgi:hypothetical protein